MFLMLVRHATLDDLDALAAVEAACFPPQEAADIDQLANRVESYPNHFWLLVNPAEPDNDCFPAQVDDGMLVSFIDGPCVGSLDLTDDMYASTALHADDAPWQMILGVNTAPMYQHRGCASFLMRHVILDSALSHRHGIVLACKEKMLPFYSSFGFIDEGRSQSVHGNAVWHQMRLPFTTSADARDDAPGADIRQATITMAMHETTAYMDHERTITSQFPQLV